MQGGGVYCAMYVQRGWRHRARYSRAVASVLGDRRQKEALRSGHGTLPTT